MASVGGSLGFVGSLQRPTEITEEKMGTNEQTSVESILKAAFKALIDKREPQAVYESDAFGEQVITPDDLREQIAHTWRNGIKRGSHPGWESLAPFYRPRRGELTVVTGVPSHGKSTFVNNLAVNLIKREEWRFGIFSAEMQPLERHLELFISQLSGFPFHDGPTARLSLPEVNSVITKLHKHVCFVRAEEAPTVDGLVDIGRWMSKRPEGVDGLIIDPWNEVDASRPVWQSETEFVSVSLSRLRNLARTQNIHIWLIAHPQKLYPDKDGNYPKPTMYSISGSAHFRNKADMGLMVWRDVLQENSPTEIHIQKVRFRENGKPGMVPMRFNPITDQYHDW